MAVNNGCLDQHRCLSSNRVKKLKLLETFKNKLCHTLSCAVLFSYKALILAMYTKQDQHLLQTVCYTHVIVWICSLALKM